jgi:hypothetical protein
MDTKWVKSKLECFVNWGHMWNSVCLTTTAVLCITDMDTHCVCCCDMQEQPFCFPAGYIYIYIKPKIYINYQLKV